MLEHVSVAWDFKNRNRMSSLPRNSPTKQLHANIPVPVHMQNNEPSAVCIEMPAFCFDVIAFLILVFNFFHSKFQSIIHVHSNMSIAKSHDIHNIIILSNTLGTLCKNIISLCIRSHSWGNLELMQLNSFLDVSLLN